MSLCRLRPNTLLGWLEQRLVVWNSLGESIAQRGGVREISLLSLARTRPGRVLERIDDQSDVLTGDVAHRQQNDKFLGGIVGSVPARIEDGDALLNHVDVVRVVRIAYALRKRTGEHRVDVFLSGRDAVQGNAEQLRVLCHGVVAQLLRVDLERGRSPVLLLRISRPDNRIAESANAECGEAQDVGEGFHCSIVPGVVIVTLKTSQRAWRRTCARSASTLTRRRCCR